MIHARPIHSLALLALLALGTRTAAQNPPASGARDARDSGGNVVLSLAELVLDQYAVQNVDGEELFDLAQGLAGRKYYVKENGNAPALSNLRLLGSTIVLYDTKDQVQRVRELLTKLDAKHEQAASAVRAVEYAPRFVSLDTAAHAIKDLVYSMNLVAPRGVIVVRGEGASIDAALALLKRIDVPDKQVLLSCQLVDVGDSADGLALPKELTDNLQKLLPDVRFAQVGMAMLKTSVRSGSPVSVEIESTGKRYGFSFEPVAFDETTGSLTVTRCSLIEHVGDGVRELFSTSTVLRGGEYTVLAATGATPRLLVVRVTPQG